MNYKEYQKVRDATWRILLDCRIAQLPTDLNLICKLLGIKVYSYQSAAIFIQKQGLLHLAQGTDGFTTFCQGGPVVFYNQEKIPPRIRFTIGHELGHLLLNHIEPGGITVMNRDPSPKDDPLEQEANAMSARLLAPACVLWGLGLHTSEDVATICHISQKAAAFRAARMAELYRRGKFLTSPLEREVYAQFQPFIKESQRTPPVV